ncbi:nucleotidyltransferase family protein [Spirosoma panaciterrae]|uniref:nucleotidyltransferase family protein n=1 Tax=Spirosoma panaciterrae TaxID=496058 RepID=UPI000372FA5A|nr:nucleotidyltransferase domain-containing protein [Spirosoma panaciterrae]
MMHSYLQSYTDKINALCRHHNVVRLYAFGSVTSEEFDEEKSDVDLLVELSDELAPEVKGETYFTLLFELEKLFHRPVDLLLGQSFRNPYFARAVEQSKQLLYAA